MVVKFTKEEIERLLSGYFKRKEGFDSVQINALKSYDYYDHEFCYVTASLTKRMVIFGKEKSAVETIGEQVITNILQKQLEEAGYEVDGISLDYGLNYETTGYYKGEQTETIPYFNGASANIYDHEKTKTIGRS